MKKALLLVTVMMGVAFIHREAQATTTVHGNACQPVSAGGFGNPQPSVFGWFNSATTSTINVQCGMASVPTASKFFSILVFDRNPTSDVTCRVIGLNNNGVQVYDSMPVHSNASGPNSQLILTPIPPTSVLFYTVSCTIPASVSGQASHVTGFFVD